MREIASRYSFSESYIGQINSGTKKKLANETYPLRDTNRNFNIDSKILNEITKLLNDTELKQEDIAKMYNISRKTVTFINNGNTFYRSEINYPIRKNKVNTNDFKILNDIINTSITFNQLSIKHSVRLDRIYRLNSGEASKKLYEEYEKENNTIINFPARNTNYGLDEEYEKCIKLLTNCKYLSYIEIQEKTGINRKTISNYNNGKVKKFNEYALKHHNIENFPILNF